MKSTNQKLIVFDLDETLIHSTKNKLNLTEDYTFEDYYIYKRPFLDEFLYQCSELCSIAIWSSADDNYVKEVTKQLIPKDIKMEFIWGRSDCWLKLVKKQDSENPELFKKEHQFIKPLEKIRRKGYRMNNLLIVDDSLFKVTDNPNNFIIVDSFEGKTDDNELIELLIYLKNKLLNEGGFIKIESLKWKK